MTASPDHRMVEEFLAGRTVPEIAARYNVTEEYVDRVIEETHLNEPAKPAKPKRSWSLNLIGNRIAASLLLAILINVVTGTWIGWAVGAVVFVLISAIVTAGRSGD